MKHMSSRILALVVLLPLALCTGGCGYSSGLKITQNYDTLGVELFGNETMERDLEPLMHAQLTEVLTEISDARLVSPERARGVIRGTLIRYQRRNGIRSQDNQLLETGITIEVEAGLYVRGSETPLRTARALTSVGYVLDAPGNERVARERALRHIAEELVLELFGPG